VTESCLLRSARPMELVSTSSISTVPPAGSHRRNSATPKEDLPSNHTHNRITHPHHKHTPTSHTHPHHTHTRITTRTTPLHHTTGSHPSPHHTLAHPVSPKIPPHAGGPVGLL